jgi:hypothetical protein
VLLQSIGRRAHIAHNQRDMAAPQCRKQLHSPQRLLALHRLGHYHHAAAITIAVAAAALAAPAALADAKPFEKAVDGRRLRAAHAGSVRGQR